MTLLSISTIRSIQMSAEGPNLLQRGETLTILRAMVRIAEHWDLSDEQIARLLSMSDLEWSTAKSSHFGDCLSDDQETRAGLLLSIYKFLRLVFSGTLINTWITRKNSGPLFDGKSPLEIMLGGGDLSGIKTVRTYLESLHYA